jgi:hypothetical protein
MADLMALDRRKRKEKDIVLYRSALLVLWLEEKE